jgi:8-oxo-dGTP pyrophosphatase MutT (NUDIX family)
MKIISLADTIDTAAVVVFNSEGQALVLKRGPTAPWEPNKWNLPGGGIEERETREEAAIRECKEEAGIVPSNVSFLGFFENLAIYVGKSDSSPTINFESSAFQWITENEIQELDFVSIVGIILIEAFSKNGTSSEVPSRKEDGEED